MENMVNNIVDSFAAQLQKNLCLCNNCSANIHQECPYTIWDDECRNDKKHQLIQILGIISDTAYDVKEEFGSED